VLLLVVPGPEPPLRTLDDVLVRQAADGMTIVIE
jgi:hypothetical protein